MTDADLTTICGLIMRGTSLPTACELTGVTMEALFDHIGDNATDIGSLCGALMHRAKMIEAMDGLDGDPNS